MRFVPRCVHAQVYLAGCLHDQDVLLFALPSGVLHVASWASTRALDQAHTTATVQVRGPLGYDGRAALEAVA